jgi:hypothetical protein
MASILVTEAPQGMTLEEARTSIAAAAARLNGERAKMDVVLFANVYVGPVLLTPGTGATSFLVSYADKDIDVQEFLNNEITRLGNLQKSNSLWFALRDWYQT